MQYRTLGRTGVQVSSLVHRAMNFGAAAIDEIVAPGTDRAPEEKNDTPPSLLDSALRRR